MSRKIKKPLNQILNFVIGPKFFILGPILFLSLNISANLINKKVTGFSWVPDPEKSYRGNCYEYDLETGGQKFQAIAKKIKCRPEKTETLWVPSEEGVSGKCYEVDSETKGEKFVIPSSASNCVTKEVSYSWALVSETSGECYQIDGNLKRRVSKDNCAPKKVSHHWVPRTSGWGGKCFAIDSLQGPAGYIESVSVENCKPSETSYTLHMKREGEQGYCYEVDLKNGPKGYSRRVSRSNCFNSAAPNYMWKSDESGVDGECLEVRSSINEKVSSRKVDFKKCINFKTKNFFKRTSSFGGSCLLVDELTGGQRFAKVITTSSCREEVEDFQYSLLPNQYGNPICVESDLKTNGNLYVGKVSLSKCEDTGAKPKWVLEDDGWSGKCVEMRTLGSNVRERSIRKEKCRTAKTKFIWHNFKKLDGKCFEVDVEKGNDGFVIEAPLKKCAPKFLKYIFYREKGENAGHCYLVDRETSGEKFNKPISSKKCKRSLIKAPL